jgi:hypothetical protein
MKEFYKEHKKYYEENPVLMKIKNWKRQGIICEYWEFMYSIFMWWFICIPYLCGGIPAIGVSKN